MNEKRELLEEVTIHGNSIKCFHVTWIEGYENSNGDLYYEPQEEYVISINGVDDDLAFYDPAEVNEMMEDAIMRVLES